MENTSKRVILMFEGFDEDGRLEELRRLYTKTLPQFIAGLHPEWVNQVEREFPELTDAVINFPYGLAGAFGILTADDMLSCQPCFGFYDPRRDAVMMWLQPLEETEQQPTTLEALFGEAVTYPQPTFCYYLVFSLSDVRIGNVVQTDLDSSRHRYPQHLTVGRRDEIFDAGGFPRLQSK